MTASDGVCANTVQTIPLPAVADFNGDGRSDILFQHENGDLLAWEMNGATIVPGSGEIANPGLSWHVSGIGDFNGDGRADILFQHDSGDLLVWEMNGATIVGGGEI